MAVMGWRRGSLRRGCALVAAAVAGSVVLTASPAAAVPVSGTEVVESVSTAPANSVVTVTAACPSGKAVTGGGFHLSWTSTDIGVLRLRESRPVPGVGWRVTVRNVGSVPRSVHAYAVCSSGASPTYHSTTFTVPANGEADRSLTCPAGVPAGGGFSLDTDLPNIYVSQSWPDWDATRWDVRAHNESGSARTATAWIVCGNFSDATVANQIAFIQSWYGSPYYTHYSEPECPGNRVPTGGGFAFYGNSLSSVFVGRSTPSYGTDGWRVVFWGWSAGVGFGRVICVAGT